MENETVGERSRPPDQEQERLECRCDPYVWDEEGENVVDYDGSCYCEAGADSRERVARQRRREEISLMGYVLDEGCNHVDVGGNMVVEADGEKADGEREQGAQVDMRSAAGEARAKIEDVSSWYNGGH